jgi:hypothetical protein
VNLARFGFLAGHHGQSRMSGAVIAHQWSRKAAALADFCVTLIVIAMVSSRMSCTVMGSSSALGRPHLITDH